MFSALTPFSPLPFQENNFFKIKFQLSGMGEGPWERGFR
jgi:hypothetical protein